MGHYVDLFSPEALDAIRAKSAAVKLFQAQDWQDYLRILAAIYDLLASAEGPVEFTRVEGIVDAILRQRGVAFIGQARAQMLKKLIEDWEVLKDYHDGAGRRRYAAPTPEGQRLLLLIAELIKNRKSYIGRGAESLLDALNELLLDVPSLSAKEAINRHKAEIKKLEEDILRIEQGGVSRSKLLLASPRDELFARADEEAAAILASSETIKAAVQTARRDLADGCFNGTLSPGDAVGKVTEFHKALHEQQEYRSFQQAKDVLSMIEGLSPQFAYTDVDLLLRKLIDRGILGQSAATQSSLAHFQSQFLKITMDIGAQAEAEFKILKRQVSYAAMGNSRRIQQTLTTLVSEAAKKPEDTLAFFAKGAPGALEVDGLRWAGKNVALNDFRVKTAIEGEVIGDPSGDALDFSAVADQLKRADEATIKRAVSRILGELQKRGVFRLSTFDFALGLIEPYVLLAGEALLPGVTVREVPEAPAVTATLAVGRLRFKVMLGQEQEFSLDGERKLDA